MNMKQYKVLKEMINAPVGTILVENENGFGIDLDKDVFYKHVLNYCQIEEALKQKFIEPYTPEPKHWRAEKHSCYFTVDEIGNIDRRAECHTKLDDDLYVTGHYFTESTAELVAKAQKLFFELLHNKSVWVFDDDEDIKKLLRAIDVAQDAVLEDDSNE